MYISNNVAERIKIIAKANGVSIKQLLEDIGLGFNTMSNMKNSMPRADNLARIADYLNCSVDYLLGRTDSPKKEEAPTTKDGETLDNEYKLLTSYHELNEEGQKKLIDYADDLVTSGKYIKSPAPRMVQDA